MEAITLILLGGLVAAFVGAILTDRFEFNIMSIMLTFCAFVAVNKDASLVSDTVMLLYVPIIAMGLFSIASFFRAKIR